MIKKLQNQSFFKEFKESVSLDHFQNSKSHNYRALAGSGEFSSEERTKIVIEGQSGKIKIGEFCIRKGITPVVFYKWTQEFLKNNTLDSNINFLEKKERKEDEKFKIVIEGKSGETSIAQICRRENITHDTFLDWSQSFLNNRRKDLYSLKQLSPEYRKKKEIISLEAGEESFSYFENYINFSTEKSLVVLNSDVLKFDDIKYVDNVINFQKINDIRYINKYFENVNSKLKTDGVFIGCMETFSARRKRMSVNRIPVVNNLYFLIEFLFKRILPKISLTKKYYFDITKGSDRLLSKAEGLGRLVSCGFKIMDYRSINGLLYFVVKKCREPYFDLSPSYGPLYKMPRLGRNGKIIGVYKFRTMHPYSEYLQDYIVNANGYSSSGKPANDFRIPVWGKIMRKFWFDELPQLINVLKGEMKLVGIRPVSERYFQDIPKEMQKLRITQKPGCIPPYVSLNRAGNVMSVLQAEKDYLEEKIKNPYSTDFKYFFKAVFNIVFNHKRSA